MCVPFSKISIGGSTADAAPSTSDPFSMRSTVVGSAGSGDLSTLTVPPRITVQVFGQVWPVVIVRVGTTTKPSGHAITLEGLGPSQGSYSVDRPASDSRNTARSAFIATGKLTSPSPNKSPQSARLPVPHNGPGDNPPGHVPPLPKHCERITASVLFATPSLLRSPQS